MTNEELRQHVDARLDHIESRFDRLDSKMDGATAKTITHEQQIHYLQGAARLIVTILIAVSGFFAAGYLSLIKGP